MIKNGTTKKKQTKYTNGINLFLIATSEIQFANFKGISLNNGFK